MNFTAKIKQQSINNNRSARYKPNYILNVNIDIPLRPNQLMSDRPVSGQFTFSPSQLKKKLKLDVPHNSIRTSRDIESRKFSSNLGDTQNTITLLNHNKKKKVTTNSSSHGHPYCLSANPSRKQHPRNNKSQSVSPKKKHSLFVGGTVNINNNMCMSVTNTHTSNGATIMSNTHYNNNHNIKGGTAAKNKNNNNNSNKYNNNSNSDNVRDSKILNKLAGLSISESEDNLIKYTTNNSEQLTNTNTIMVNKKQAKLVLSSKQIKNRNEKPISNIQLREHDNRIITETYSIFDNKNNDDSNRHPKQQQQEFEYNNDGNIVYIPMSVTEPVVRKLKTTDAMQSDEYVLMTEMREFQRKSQQKKQHINYLYIKQKILVLASVKKIQRAWRNYKTKKLLKSYSNNISLKFTNKMKDAILYSDRPNILTVRSMGNYDFNKKKKYNIQLYKQQGYPVVADKQKQQYRLRQVHTMRDPIKNVQSMDLNLSKLNKLKQSPKCKQKQSKQIGSACAKFQLEQIQRWEDLIKNIRQGKQVEDVLQTSCRRKQQLQKQINGYTNANNNNHISGTKRIQNNNNKQLQTVAVQNKNIKTKNSNRSVVNNAHNTNKHTNFRFFDDQYPSHTNNKQGRAIMKSEYANAHGSHKKTRSFGYNSDDSDRPVFIECDGYQTSSISQSAHSNVNVNNNSNQSARNNVNGVTNLSINSNSIANTLTKQPTKNDQNMKLAEQKTHKQYKPKQQQSHLIQSPVAHQHNSIEECGNTTLRNRQKLQQFQNEIRKIDNDQSSISQSMNYDASPYQYQNINKSHNDGDSDDYDNDELYDPNINQNSGQYNSKKLSAAQRQKLQNQRLRKKLLLFNQIDFQGLQSSQSSNTTKQKKKQKQSLTIPKIQNLQQIKKQAKLSAFCQQPISSQQRLYFLNQLTRYDRRQLLLHDALLEGQCQLQQKHQLQSQLLLLCRSQQEQVVYFNKANHTKKVVSHNTNSIKIVNNNAHSANIDSDRVLQQAQHEQQQNRLQTHRQITLKQSHKQEEFNINLHNHANEGNTNMVVDGSDDDDDNLIEQHSINTGSVLPVLHHRYHFSQYDSNSHNTRTNKHNNYKLTQQNKNKLCLKLQQQLVYQCLLQFSQSDSIVYKFKQVYEQQKQQQKQKNKQKQKPEGICTNLQSIKDYLQNLVAFIFCTVVYYLEQHPDVFQRGLQANYLQLSHVTLSKFCRQHEHSHEHNHEHNHKKQQYTAEEAIKGGRAMVLQQQLFEDHWAYASQQIYFDPKYPQNLQKEQQRVRYLKSITKIYFAAIFNGFNQCLEQYCPYYPSYSMMVKHAAASVTAQSIFSLISELQMSAMYGGINTAKTDNSNKNSNKNNNNNNNSAQHKVAVRNAYKKLSTFAVIYCGLHLEDKNHTMSSYMVKQIQEQRMATLLQIQIAQQEYHQWSSIEVGVEYIGLIYQLVGMCVRDVMIDATKDIHGVMLSKQLNRQQKSSLQLQVGQQYSNE